MKERPKFCGLNITRSIQDRVFLGLMGLVFMWLTGYLLYIHHTEAWHRAKTTDARLFLFILDEVILSVFLLSLSAFIWGIAAPRWIERFFEKSIRKFILMLVLISFILLAVMIYVFSVGV